MRKKKIINLFWIAFMIPANIRDETWSVNVKG